MPQSSIDCSILGWVQLATVEPHLPLRKINEVINHANTRQLNIYHGVRLKKNLSEIKLLNS